MIHSISTNKTKQTRHGTLQVANLKRPNTRNRIQKSRHRQQLQGDYLPLKGIANETTHPENSLQRRNYTFKWVVDSNETQWTEYSTGGGDERWITVVGEYAIQWMGSWVRGCLHGEEWKLEKNEGTQRQLVRPIHFKGVVAQVTVNSVKEMRKACWHPRSRTALSG